MMNVPPICSPCLLLPAQVKVDELVQHHIDPNIQILYSEKLDKVYSDHNVAVIASLLNFVCTKLVCMCCAHVCVCMYVLCACMCVCVYVCMYVCVHMCVCVYMSTTSSSINLDTIF